MPPKRGKNRRAGKHKHAEATLPTIQEDEATKKLKGMFKLYDKNGDGAIDRDELALILAKVGKFDGEEIAILMDSVDKNDDGKIQYDEFVNWVAEGDTETEMLHGTYDLELAIRPLYAAFDRDRNGALSMSEFRQCHTLLIYALRNVDHSALVKLVSASTPDVWMACNTDGNDFVSFDEFVNWFRDSISESGMKPEELTYAVLHLASLLSTALMMTSTATQRLSLLTPKSAAMQSLVKQIELDATKLFLRKAHEMHACPDPDELDPRLWLCPTPLPEGMNFESLLSVHNARISNDFTGDLRVQACVKASSSGWFCRLMNYVTQESKDYADFFYFFRTTGTSWLPMESGEDFFKELVHLPIEFKLLSLLLGTAHFRVSEEHAIPMPELTDVMLEAVDLGFLTKEEYMEFICYIEECEREQQVRNSNLDDEEPHKEALFALNDIDHFHHRRSFYEDRKEANEMRKKHARTKLQSRSFSPIGVMFHLSEAGVIREHDLWASPQLS